MAAKKRSRGKKRRLSPKHLRAIRRAARRRARKHARHKSAASRGTAARTAVRSLICGPGAVERLIRARKRVCAVNPSLGGVVGSVKGAYKPRFLLTAVPVAAGAIANGWLSGQVAMRFGVNSPILRGAIGLGTAGLLGFAAGAVKKGIGVPTALGAASQAIVATFNAIRAGGLRGLATDMVSDGEIDVIGDDEIDSTGLGEDVEEALTLEGMGEDVEQALTLEGVGEDVEEALEY